MKKQNSTEEFNRLLDATFPFVQDLLVKHREFFPLASAIERNDSIANVATYDGNEQPLSDSVIADLKKSLHQGASEGEYKAIAIFYDALVVNPSTNDKTDAVAVFVESKSDTTAYIFFFPYSFNRDSTLTISEGWKNIVDKEIFK